MSVHNGARYVRGAAESVLRQTYRALELIVVDDGSSDETPEILHSLAREDGRVRVFTHPRCAGFANGLNTGLAEARGRYVARLDADDLALPERIERQVAHLERHPEIGVLGSAVITIDAEGKPTGWRPAPVGPLVVRWTSLLKSPFGHPTLMFRRNLFRTHDLWYEQSFVPAEDYDLFVRALEVTEGDNTGAALTLYRRHGDQASMRRRSEQLHLHDTICKRTIGEALPEVSLPDELISGLWRGFTGVLDDGFADPPLLAALYLDLFDAFAVRHANDPTLKDAARTAAREVVLRTIRTGSWGQAPAISKRVLELDPLAPLRIIGDILARSARTARARRATFHQLRLGDSAPSAS